MIVHEQHATEQNTLLNMVVSQGKKSWVFQGEIKKTTTEKKATKKKLF